MTYRIVSAEVFEHAFGAARAESLIVRNATSPFSHVENTLYALSLDSRSGFAIRATGELVLVFSLERGRGDDIVRTAVAAGATHLDCFDGYLVTLYSRHGFQRVTSLPNWTPNGPDVVYMARPGHFHTAVARAESDAR